jgi:hypothetical protein
MSIIVQDSIGETTGIQESHSPLFVKQLRKQPDHAWLALAHPCDTLQDSYREKTDAPNQSLIEKVSQQIILHGVKFVPQLPKNVVFLTC